MINFHIEEKTNPRSHQIEILSYEGLMNVSNEWKINEMHFKQEFIIL